MSGIFVFIVGLAAGSFLNSYIFRLREGETHNPLQLPLILRGRDRSEPPLKVRGGEGELCSVWRGRSYCPKCKKTLRWYELVPLLSFAMQIGRCRGCRQKIDWQYPAVELVTGILFVLAYYTIELSNYQIIKSSQLATIWYLLSALVILFVYDLRYGLVPDRVVLPAIVVAFLYNLIIKLSNHQIITSFGSLVFAIAIGAGFFAIQYILSKGRWLGAGDIRIGALMGAMAGWPYIFAGIVISYIIGGAISVGLLAAGRKKFGQTLPLGTFLTLGTAIIFLYGEQIWEWYWR